MSGRHGGTIDISAPEASQAVREREIAFVERMHLMRMLGMGLGALPIASVLIAIEASWPLWALLALNALAWPQFAWWRARRSLDPRDAEFTNLLIDSAMGGAWIAVMQFSLLPSALLLMVLSIDKLSIAGWRFLARSWLALATACLLVWAVLGFVVRPQTSLVTILASLPFLFALPMAISAATHRLLRRVGEQNRQLQRLNRIDVLTALPNRRHFDEAAGNELARYLRTRRPAVLMLIDVDNFKEVNDRHGHAAGDEVLRKVASAVRTAIREIDTPARYGGDEFAVLLTETQARGALEVAQRLRSVFLSTRGEAAEREHCTLSIGLAEADRLLVTVDDWVRRADAAMYLAKGNGRDRIEIG